MTEMTLQKIDVVLISCAKGKHDHACSAEKMYTSDSFRKMLAYAQTLKPQKIFVLSAKYGLLDLQTIIEPYDQTLKNMKSIERKVWAKKVLDDLKMAANLEEDMFVILAGETYRNNLVPYICNYEIPMKGLRQGEQKSWLNRKLQENKK